MWLVNPDRLPFVPPVAGNHSTAICNFKGRIFRIGHLGDFNNLMLLGTLAGVESGLKLSGISIHRGGVDAALRRLEVNDGAPA